MSRSTRPKTAAERVAKWDKRFTADRVKQVIDAEKGLMLANNIAATTDMVHFETLTKQTINAFGVSVADIPDYLAFSREVWARQRRYAGRTLINEVETILRKWVSRCLDPEVLGAIRTEVYTIPAPAGL